MQPVLSILVASLVSRRPLLDRMLAGLEPQTRGKPVEIRVLSDAGQSPTGAKRQKLLNEAEGVYVAFIDDDDLVSPDYVSEILTAAETNADLLTFDLRRSDPRTVQEWRFTVFDVSLATQGRVRDASGRYLYCANHLCPTKREIAQAVPYLPISWREDISHSQVILAAGLVHVAVHVARVLYVYLCTGAGTWHNGPARQRATALLRVGLRAFRHVPTGRIVIDSGEPPARGSVVTYTPGGGREALAVGDLAAFHTIRL